MLYNELFEYYKISEEILINNYFSENIEIKLNNEILKNLIILLKDNTDDEIINFWNFHISLCKYDKYMENSNKSFIEFIEILTNTTISIDVEYKAYINEYFKFYDINKNV